MLPESNRAIVICSHSSNRLIQHAYWRSHLDSNQDQWHQKPLRYRYAMGVYWRHLYDSNVYHYSRFVDECTFHYANGTYGTGCTYCPHYHTVWSRALVSLGLRFILYIAATGLCSLPNTSWYVMVVVMGVVRLTRIRLHI